MNMQIIVLKMVCSWLLQCYLGKVVLKPCCLAVASEGSALQCIHLLYSVVYIHESIIIVCYGNNYSNNIYLLYMYFYTNLLTLHVATCMYFDIIYYMYNYIGYTYMYMYMYSAENIHVHVHKVNRFTKEHKHTYTSKLNLPSLSIAKNERSSCDR